MEKRYEQIQNDENEIAPNKFATRTIMVMFGIFIITLILNEAHLFHVNKWVMRASVVLSLPLTIYAIMVVRRKNMIANVRTKYFLLAANVFTTFITAVVLDQWASFIVFMPIFLGHIYHKRAPSMIGVISGSFIALLASSISCVLGFWQSDFYEFLFKSIGFEVSLVTADTNKIVSFFKVMFYIGLPRHIICLGLSSLLISNSKAHQHNIETRLDALYISEHDILTKALNRTSFENKLTEFEEQGTIHNISIIYADADGLREINDLKGHTEGDRLLVTCVSTLQSIFNTSSTYRIGGDEFVVFVTNESEDQIRIKMESVSKAVIAKGYHISMGLACSASCSDINQLMNEAEKNMYDTKNEYHNLPKKGKKKK